MASPSLNTVVTPASNPAAAPAAAASLGGPPGPRPMPPAGEWRRPRLGGAQSRALYVRWCWTCDLVIGLAGLLGTFLVTNIGHMPNGLADFLAYRLSVKSVLLLAFFGLLWR